MKGNCRESIQSINLIRKLTIKKEGWGHTTPPWYSSPEKRVDAPRPFYQAVVSLIFPEQDNPVCVRPGIIVPDTPDIGSLGKFLLVYQDTFTMEPG